MAAVLIATDADWVYDEVFAALDGAYTVSRVRAGALVESAVQRANCLLSFGIAGALAPNLRRGDVVISAEVISDGARLRATVSEFGPVLISKILDLNDTQEGVVAMVFKFSDDLQLPLQFAVGDLSGADRAQHR